MSFEEFCKTVCELAKTEPWELVDLFDYFEFYEQGKVAIDRNPVLFVIYYRERKEAVNADTCETSKLNRQFWESLDHYFETYKEV